MNKVSYIIEPEVLYDRIESGKEDGKLLVIDLSQPQLYDRLHVPGAVHLPFGLLTSGVRPATGKLPSLSQLIDVMVKIGYAKDKEIIAYDDEGGGWAGRFIWTLDLLGHKKSAYLNGGIHNWLRKKLPVNKGVTPAVAASLDTVSQLRFTHSQYNVTKNYLLENLGNNDIVLWDARSPAEYLGERCFAQRAGHIPGAVNYEWTRAMDQAKGLKIRDAREIRAELANIGITEDKEIITYCQTHHRSGFTYLLGKILGFPNIKAYSGSWSEWGNDFEVPVESGESQLIN